MPLNRGLIRAIRPQLILLGIVGGLAVASKYGLVPSQPDLLSALRTLFTQYGLVAIAVSSLLENVVGLNVYFPGSVVILTGMALTAGNPAQAVKTWLVILCFGFVAHNFNFFAGRWMNAQGKTISAYSSGRLKNKEKNLLPLFLGTFWHPHFAAVTSLACGANTLPYTIFLGHLALALGIWYGFWGLLLFNIGKALPESMNLLPVFLAYVLIWIIWDLVHYYRHDSTRSTSH